MKNLFALIALFALMSFTAPIIHAQEVTADSLTIAKPVFTEKQNLTDSVLAIGDVLTDPQSQVVISDVVTQLQNTPTDGKFQSWYGWGVALLLALISAFRYFRQKFNQKETNVKNE